MLLWKVIGFIGLLHSLNHVLGQDPIVNLSQGRIVGIKVYVKDSDVPIEIFFGIPYAAAPIGRLRFSAPEKHPGWRRTFFAHRMPLRCPQPRINSTDFSEDCLFLNVWTSRRGDAKLQPVLVILYSESWSHGGIDLPCQELAADGVVVVTVAYRLHLLSFFTLRSLTARGNLAILDQYLALVWIRENIAAFGGDPSLVTLAGHSAGANSVLYHILSPRPSGLFNRAIVMSPRDIWKMFNEKIQANSSGIEKISREVAKHLGCSYKLDRDILQCMRAHNVADILNFRSEELFLDDYLQPVADEFLPESEQYLPLPPLKLLSSSKSSNMQLDLLIGNTNLEVINFFDTKIHTKLMQQNPNTVYEYAKNEIIPMILRILAYDQSEALLTLTQVIEWEYWKSKLIPGHNENKAVEYIALMESAAKWCAGEAIIAAKISHRISRLYVYRYLQPSSIDLTGKHHNFTGAVHGTDLIALLGDSLMLQVARRAPSKSEKQISSIFRNYVVNFIKLGSPANQEEWPRYISKYRNVHEICFKNEAGVNCNEHSINRDITFWLQYLPKFINSVLKLEQSEKFGIVEDESRLRGGIFAMCGVSVTLMVLLLLCGILLHRKKIYRPSMSEDGTQL